MNNLNIENQRRDNMEFLANLIANLGITAAVTGAKACLFMMMDEPECPESLIK